uniref:Uncharacterized protein n=1 Tax=Arundo donax TaxID=35708 RepID=A0A0A8YU49_ARUDO
MIFIFTLCAYFSDLSTCSDDLNNFRHFRGVILN